MQEMEGRYVFLEGEGDWKTDRMLLACPYAWGWGEACPYAWGWGEGHQPLSPLKNDLH